MSHLPERKEKICLNCKSVVYGRFCHVCGQENVEPKETFWGLITHFVYDLVHFDGRFFTTTRSLLFRPGFLAREFFRGRRASYVNPIKMYIFTSAFFFILFFSFIAPRNADSLLTTNERQELQVERSKLEKQLATETDSLRRSNLVRKISRVNQRLERYERPIVDVAAGEADTSRRSAFNVFGDDFLPKTVAEYDSLQAVLPAAERDGWFKKLISRKIIAVNDKYRYNELEFWQRFKDKFYHSIPQMMFVSLPLVALILQLLYVRHRRQYYYVNHVVFTLNLYIAIYILLLLMYAFTSLYILTGAGIFKWVDNIIFLLIFFYVYKSMRHFYGQRRALTIMKFIFFILAFALLMLLLLTIYFLTTTLQL